MPGLHRAAKIQRRAASVGFDWTSAAAVFDKVQEEIAELEVALPDRSSAAHELGDLLFSVVNLARHLEIDPELALAAGIERFIARFRSMEAAGPLHGLTVAELEDRWEAAKRTSSRS
jgi:ATP diphosphatase